MPDVEIKIGQVSEYKYLRVFIAQLVTLIVALALTILIMKFILPLFLKLFS
jgi:hypothetical protein